ncbi:hypothetical protein PRVXH_001994 [Proteinivorax hydrogeniformans]|uniref:Bypass of forespore C C-terminal domain-containing protein n=1 Tax=Proteinivorax hydrogeniformans TaxID=1826727 RepID=A0AAU8HRN4_9FIRM
MIYKGRLVKFYAVIVILVALLIVLIASFLYLLPASAPDIEQENVSIPTNEDEPPTFKDDLVVKVIYKCEVCGEVNDPKKAKYFEGRFSGETIRDFNEEIKEQYPNLEPKQVTNQEILILKQSEEEFCSNCLEYKYAKIEGTSLVFYKGHPKIGNETERLENIVNFVGDQEQLQKFQEGIPLDNSYELYIGVFRGKLTLFKDKPVHSQPLIQFLDLEIRADAIGMLEDEGRIESLGDLIDILENYAS